MSDVRMSGVVSRILVNMSDTTWAVVAIIVVLIWLLTILTDMMRWNAHEARRIRAEMITKLDELREEFYDGIGDLHSMLRDDEDQIEYLLERAAREIGDGDDSGYEPNDSFEIM